MLAILAILLVGILVFAAGCEKKESSDTDFAIARARATGLVKVKVSEVTHSIFYAPQYVAMGLGFFADEGLEIELTNAGGADKVMTAVMSGDANIGLCGPEQTVYVFNQGQANYPVNIGQLTQCDGSFIVAREPDSEFVIDKFKGKHILGGRKGGMPVMALEYTLVQNGITPGVDCVVDTSIAFDALPGAFIGGTGDYVSLFEPTAGSLESQGYGYIVKSLGELSGKIPYTCYNARLEYISQNRETVESFMAAVKKGQDFVQGHTASEIAEAIAPYFADTSMETLASVIERYKSIDAYASSPFLTEESFDLLLDILDNAGELSARLDYADIVLTDFMQ
jgi:NitT/TauT family transport system substrate-binding protein